MGCFRASCEGLREEAKQEALTKETNKSFKPTTSTRRLNSGVRLSIWERGNGVVIRNGLSVVATTILSVLIAIFLTGCGDGGSSNEEWSDENKQVLKWLNKPDDPLRPQDYENTYFAELSHAIEAKKIVYLEYAGTKDISHRKVLPERLFRRGEYVYLEVFCLMRNQYRRFRLDRIKDLSVEPNSLR